MTPTPAPESPTLAPPDSEQGPGSFLERLLMNRWSMARLAVLAATLLTVAWALDRLGLKDMLVTSWVDGQVKGHGLIGIALFVAVSAVATAIGIPRQIPAFLGGYAFGPVQGVGLALLATVLGAGMGFLYARFMGRSWATRSFPKTLQWLDAFLSGNTFAMVLALRFAPFTSNLVTNLAAGVSGAALAPFLIASSLGYLPQTVAFALLGCGTTIDPVVNGGIFIGLIVTSSGLGVWMWRTNRRRGRRVDA